MRPRADLVGRDSRRPGRVALNGLVLGALYVLMALGLSIIFGMVGVINFAHGALFTLGA